MAVSQALQDHLDTGITTLCRCWLLKRRDGWERGFTDHDETLSFEGKVFQANSGLSARALMQTTGLALDNTEAVGALSDVSVTEADIRAGRFDGAEVTSWLVNWAAVGERALQFRGTLGELTRSGGAFQAELLGISEALNQPQGRVYQKQCSAVLGDEMCAFDTSSPGFSENVTVISVEDGVRFLVDAQSGQEDRWFERGFFEVLDGDAAGLTGIIKNDQRRENGRLIEAWQSVRAPLVAGDSLRLVAGCDKRRATCKKKFDNLLNFQGFPHIPGEERLLSVPIEGQTTDTTGDAK